MYVIPTKVNQDLKLFAKKIGCSWIGAVEVNSKPLSAELNCHANVLNYINTYGGSHGIGYYFIQNINSGKFEAILHSVLKKNNQLIDITPFSDSREYNIIGLLEVDTLHKLENHIIQ
jgi:hypothetical protein